MAEPGLDLSCISDLDANLSTVSGRLALSQALVRRLMTPLGSLFYDPEYGFDLRQFLSAQISNVADIESGAEAEVLKDERVSRASATASFVGDVLTIKLVVVDDQGPFSLTVAATALTVKLLSPTT